jgi:hypothetical protein
LNAVIGVAAIRRFIYFDLERFADRCRCDPVGFTDAKVENFKAGVHLAGFCFGPFDLFEFINLGRFSVVFAADPFGKQLLCIHHDFSLILN